MLGSGVLVSGKTSGVEDGITVDVRLGVLSAGAVFVGSGVLLTRGASIVYRANKVAATWVEMAAGSAVGGRRD